MYITIVIVLEATFSSVIMSHGKCERKRNIDIKLYIITILYIVYYYYIVYYNLYCYILTVSKKKGKTVILKVVLQNWRDREEIFCII